VVVACFAHSQVKYLHSDEWQLSYAVFYGARLSESFKEKQSCPDRSLTLPSRRFEHVLRIHHLCAAQWNGATAALSRKKGKSPEAKIHSTGRACDFSGLKRLGGSMMVGVAKSKVDVVMGLTQPRTGDSLVLVSTTDCGGRYRRSLIKLLLVFSHLFPIPKDVSH